MIWHGNDCGVDLYFFGCLEKVLYGIICGYNNKNMSINDEEIKYCYKYPHPSVTTDCVIFGFDGEN